MKWTVLVAVMVLCCLQQDASAGVIKQHPKIRYARSAPLRNIHTHKHVKVLAEHNLYICCLHANILDFYLWNILTTTEIYPHLTSVRVDLHRVSRDLKGRGCPIKHVDDHGHSKRFKEVFLKQDASAVVIKQHPKIRYARSAPLTNIHTHKHVKVLPEHQDASAGVIKQHPKIRYARSAPLTNIHTHKHVKVLAEHAQNLDNDTDTRLMPPANHSENQTNLYICCLHANILDFYLWNILTTTEIYPHLTSVRVNLHRVSRDLKGRGCVSIAVFSYFKRVVGLWMVEDSESEHERESGDLEGSYTCPVVTIGIISGHHRCPKRCQSQS
ncbi:hypothetical protein AAFF_G00369190 [Aldrovandia affinis]|uniref:Uncharacterized protein n=1 Tax=Aldrovandia affinis TaxID=143900 RepID=A0AAD7SH97_9TELE|nr:hypothetical protein AAFF_G00369190 [Aldrovandia affinis]